MDPPAAKATEKTLGKRKIREEGDTLAHGATLFVSNLPYSATSVDLQTLFSDIAPVRSAFVVTEQGTGVSKGVGYVSFALKEDAESAYETLSKDGINLVNRKLRVQWADSKPKEGEAVKKEPKPRPAPRQPRLPNDPLATRTIVVSGLPTSIDSKVLWKKIRKYTGAEKVDWPVKDDAGKEDPTTAHVLFTSPGFASDAVTKLHAHVYKGNLLSVTLKKRLDVLSKPMTAPKAADPKGKAAAAPSHASRLIVRNIPFNASEQDLRAVFLPYGPIHSVHIPLDEKAKGDETKKEDEAESSTAAATAAAYAGARKPRTKGFAFVWMLSKKDAERAIEGCNGMVLRAGTAQTLAQSKQKKKKLNRLEKKAAAVAAAVGKKTQEGEKEDEEADEDEDEDEDMDKETDDKRATERVIAVDWALSKEKWKEEKAKVGDDVEMESTSGSDEGSGSDEDSDDDALGVHSGSEGESDESDSQAEDSDNEEEPTKPQLPPPETGTTLFIRNIPFDATEDELRTLFRSFGPLRYVRITMDQATGRSRGTGFACFWNLEDADRVVQQSDLLRSETTGQTIMPKKNPFSLPSILTPDPSSSLAHSLVLHGRTLDVIRAVTRDVAGKLKHDNEKAREKADKRNMYLLREGVIMPNTPAAENLTPAEVERRTSSFNARRALLKTNPSLFISKTRLSVRQIPIFVTERMLKRLTTFAIKTFNAEVKQGSRTALSADELADPPATKPEETASVSKVEDADGDDGEKKKSKKRFTGRDTGVKQTKIVRQAERVDPLTGKGRSKGYGFVEMHRHSDALRFLRWANNNAAVGPLFESWWKDELEHLLKMERAKEESERDDAKIKRLKEEIENEGRNKKISKGSLIVEFSIENIQVVQRRDASQRNQEKPSAHEGVAKSADKKHKKEHDDEPSPKKRRVSTKSEDKTTHKVEPAQAELPKSNPLGAIIGRKRKERKVGKTGRR
ncbi:hypothetical protein BDN70DRAFT_709860 [Pholiota conissans]|uniref:RRM domain-containing protein n=1 Tax=Pholiota conissans TaxID=109636 RepID=A0A9P5Z2Y1_9AGAR|nr:hypothetical protein BDN70DRAFT_709860 [Pholiota conissans]